MSAHVERAIPGHAPTALSVFRFVIVPDVMGANIEADRADMAKIEAAVRAA